MEDLVWKPTVISVRAGAIQTVQGQHKQIFISLLFIWASDSAGITWAYILDDDSRESQL